MHVERATPDHAAALTAIAFAAKRHWGYPEEWIESWRDLLTIEPRFIASHDTYVAMVDERAVGFYALERKDGTLELSHLWVWPEAMGRGIGRALFEHAVERARESGFPRLEIESDPNAEEFYRHMGARRVGSRAKKLDSRPRDLPILIYEIRNVPHQQPPSP